MRTFKEWRDCSTDLCSNTPIHTAGAYMCHLNESEEYEDGDILNVWFLFNQSSPASMKFVVGLSELLSECYPSEHRFSEIVESKLSSLAHKHILVRHGDER